MKKRAIISVCVVIVLVALISFAIYATGLVDYSEFFGRWKKAGENTATAVTVNGEAISQADIAQSVLAAELSYQNGAAALKGSALPETEKQEKLAELDAARSEAAVTKKLIRNTLLMQEAKRQGITVSNKEARAEAEKQYALLKQSGNAADIAFVQAFLEEKGWSEKEYLTYAADVYRRMLAINRLAEKLGADQMDPLAERLTEEAEIVYP